jgi:hypothetical protein
MAERLIPVQKSAGGGTGSSGSAGSSGSSGSSGTTGSSGSSGTSGSSGSRGTSGSSGSSGTVGLGLIPPLTYAGDHILGADEVLGQVIYVTGAGTQTLPPVVVGSSVTVYATGAFVISVDPDNADRIVNDGVALADGHKITSSGAAGDFVNLHADSVNGWTMIGRGANAWTDGG